MWMTFCGSSSSTGVAGASGARSTTSFGGSGFGASTGFGGGAAMDSRMREIGGNTVVFFLTSPSSDFFGAACLSINETLSTWRFGAGGGLCAAGFLTSGAGAGSVFFLTTLALPEAGFVAAVLRVAVFFAAVLLVVFVAILISKNLFHGSLGRAGVLRCCFFSRHGRMDFLRLRFIDAEDVHEIRDVRVAQSF